MSIDTAITTAIKAAVTEAIGPLLVKVAAQSAVLKDLADRGRLPTAANDPANTYRLGIGAAVRWQYDVWAIAPGGRITRNGQPATSPDKTANVEMIGVDAAGRLVQRNTAGEVRYWADAPDWPLIRAEAPGLPVISIDA